jgi:hypothetical protein
MENINLAIVEDDAVIRESLENFLAVVHILRYKFKRVIKIAGKKANQSGVFQSKATGILGSGTSFNREERGSDAEPLH